MDPNFTIKEEEKIFWETGLHALGFEVIIGGPHGVIFRQIVPSEQEAERLLTGKQKELKALPALCGIRKIFECTYGAIALGVGGAGRSGRKARKLLRSGKVSPKRIKDGSHEMRHVP